MLESEETNQLNAPIEPLRKRGGQIGSSQLNSNQNTSIAIAFKRAGLDWRENFAHAILANDRKRIALWTRLLPYMVSRNHRNVKKGKASKAAIKALTDLENE